MSQVQCIAGEKLADNQVFALATPEPQVENGNAT